MQLRLQKGDFNLDVSLELPARGIIALFGPSGSGKSSLLRALAGLEPNTKGQLTVNGQCWQDQDSFMAPHKRTVGLVFQESSLFAHLDVKGNILYGRKRAGHRAQQIDLQHLLELLGIQHLLSRSVDQLSGGERQRVAIVRALAINPSLLLLDEPMTGLDQARRNELMPYLQRLHRELAIPIIYVSHDRHEVAQLAEHLVLIERGRVQAYGRMSDMYTRLSLPLAHTADAEAILDAVVDGYDAEYQLLRLKLDGGHFWLPGPQSAIGDAVRVQIWAKDVSICLDKPRQTSILNILEAQIQALMEVGCGQVLLKLQLGSQVLLARLTQKSADLLGLHAGQKVYVQVKSVALLG
ncbi:molybdenum ABC transporter ATP-binding protein [Aliiglaciecola sp. CAU 1673]|uniref:molybdenum ABC transporter ATP-binding protein n=1 Tax=Aliiglaciecola sp. CAU 1673 TaxID=3032595 RepID=UPI0023DBC241|nr:molybdenum ABC transporter ATP-binding protein [Aliiglaciecola sp. CAU 1673]MDF2177391.1 molybdenum ABC transporter ATP-binding protein [Aliiglaciecola sp. CAU 1673]